MAGGYHAVLDFSSIVRSFLFASLKVNIGLLQSPSLLTAIYVTCFPRLHVAVTHAHARGGVAARLVRDVRDAAALCRRDGGAPVDGKVRIATLCWSNNNIHTLKTNISINSISMHAILYIYITFLFRTDLNKTQQNIF